MKDHEKRAIIEDEIRNQVRSEMKRVNLRRLVDELMSQIVEEHMRDYQFPEKSIPSSSIDFSDFSLDQDRCKITHFDNFKSGGIEDNATTTQITIDGETVRIKNLVVENINIGRRLDVKGKIRIGDPAYVRIVDSVTNQALTKFSKHLEKVDWCVENITTLQNDQGEIKTKLKER